MVGIRLVIGGLVRKSCESFSVQFNQLVESFGAKGETTLGQLAEQQSNEKDVGGRDE